MKYLLTKKKESIPVSEQDYWDLAKFTWWVNKRGYVWGKPYGKLVLLHRFILRFPNSGIDHINGNKLDNRRENLRLASQSQNSCNRKKISGTSRFKGVSLHKSGKWHAQINHKSLGYFDNEISAARAYDSAAVILHGKFAVLKL